MLRQTSSLALEEKIHFRTVGGNEGSTRLVDGYHKARFGEIEQRGGAVTSAGRVLYDELLATSMALARRGDGDGETAATPQETDAILAEVFRRYSDSWHELWKLNLIYFTYRVRAGSGPRHLPSSSSLKTTASLSDLLAASIIDMSPLTYEDFLPISAAGIFQPNITGSGRDQP